ncbi:hypothetical protein CR194_07605 [Salipaludibacillus keqinensis]|uniref:Uncharacterized protein n=1 Tax=Salipaludibacillus keqinensis TaxID=2045207 RepID=A0A323TUE1_9BACI|nr:hypothetical protein [Salipaludibacillus keqinensis]PYZ93055.1 hypothetical protein CR194_07605 [Salipaludibacillus keqinensis]
MNPKIALNMLMGIFLSIMIFGCATGNTDEENDPSNNESEETNNSEDVGAEENTSNGGADEENAVEDNDNEIAENENADEEIDSSNNEAEETDNAEDLDAEENMSNEVPEEEEGVEENDNEMAENENEVEEDLSEAEFDHPAAEMTFNYYQHLKNEEFEQSVSYVNTDYLHFLGLTERDYVNTYKDNQTLNDWRIEEISIRSVDEVTMDVRIPEVFEQLITQSENYIVIVDLRVSNFGEVSGVVDDVLVSVDEDGDWKIYGIVSY